MEELSFVSKPHSLFLWKLLYFFGHHFRQVSPGGLSRNGTIMEMETGKKKLESWASG